MKKIFITLSAILLLGLNACETVYYYEYSIENETNYSIKIEGYDRFEIVYSNDGLTNTKTRNNDYLTEVEIINIQPNSNYSVFKGLGFVAEGQGVFGNVGIDSVNIIFDNQKALVQYCDEESLRNCYFERNIMNIDTEYERVETGRSSGEIEYSFTYTITVADYERAVPFEAK